MAKISKYSVWLMPGADVRNRVQNKIIKLSEKNKTPVFDPHITLVSNIIGTEKEVVRKTRKLAESLEPFMIRLEKIGFSDDYFKCLYSKVKDNNLLKKANSAAKKIFGFEESLEYDPHMSLMYGTVSDEIKKKIMKYCLTDFSENFYVDRIFLVLSNSKNEWTIVRQFLLV